VTINPPHVTAALDQAWAEVADHVSVLVECYPADGNRRELASLLCDQAWIQNETPTEAVASLATMLACAIGRLADQYNERKRS
jgi:hypothetical protein